MTDVMVNWVPAECLTFDRPVVIGDERHIAGLLQFFANFDTEVDDICDLCGGYDE